MSSMTEAPATILIDRQHDLIATSRTTVLPTARRRPAALLHFLRHLVTSWTRGWAFESRWIKPGLPCYEAPIDLLAQRSTYLYICSMSG